MARVHATTSCQAPRAEVEARWYDTSLWPRFVDGCAAVERVAGAWPSAGSVVDWRSTPEGRGTVRERVVEHEPGAFQELAVADPQLEGRQRISFRPLPEGACEVSLELEYRLRRQMPWTWLLDMLFVRAAVAASLRRTLSRFAAQFG